MWLANLMAAGHDDRAILERAERLAALLRQPACPVFVISNETGLGVVPLGELTRRYVDEAGWLHQAVAERAERVVFTVAGLPMLLKGEPL